MKVNSLRFFIFFYCYFLFSGVESFAQQSLNGAIVDSLDNEPLVSVLVCNGNNCVYSDDYGEFVIQAGNQDTLLFSLIGFKPKRVAVLDQGFISVKLAPVKLVNEVIITAGREIENYQNLFTGAMFLDPQKLELLPAVFGENDIIKSLHNYPGVQRGQEGQSNFYVRGGLADENLILLDGMPVYNTNHMLGLVSIFNSSSIKNATLYKNYISPRFSGRLSSVLDVKMKEGNTKSTHASLKIGAISSNATLEGPLFSKKLSYFISARFSTLNYLLNPILKNSPDFPQFNFNDWNVKLRYTINENMSIHYSSYNSTDSYSFIINDNQDQLTDSSRFKSATNLLRYNIRLKNNIKGYLLLGHTDYINRNEYNLFSESTIQNNKLIYDFSRNRANSISDLLLKTNVTSFFNSYGTLDIGVNHIIHSSKPNQFNSKLLIVAKNDTLSNKEIVGKGNEDRIGITNMYLDYTNSIGKFHLNSGFNISYSDQFRIEPRIRLSYDLESILLNASFQNTNQFLHFVSNEYFGVPFEQWLLTDEFLAPKTSNQYNLGISKSFGKVFTFSTDVYFKTTSNVYLFPLGVNLNDIDDFKQVLIPAQNRSYGVEFNSNVNAEKWNLTFNYTFSRTDSKYLNSEIFEDWFPASNDRRHVLHINGVYHLHPQHKLSFNWDFNSGNSYTFYSGKYYISHGTSINDNPILVNQLDSPNNIRLSNYHKADIGYRYILEKKKFKHEFGLNIYNVYNRRNPYFVRQSINYNDQFQAELGLEQFSLFPIIPSFYYKVEI